MDAYRRLAAWQRCRELTLVTYRLTQGFPPRERFGLTSQLRRAAVSCCANIAEGYGRKGRNELRHFLGTTLGSLAEFSTLIVLAHDLGLLADTQFHELHAAYQQASKTTYGLLKAVRR